MSTKNLIQRRSKNGVVYMTNKAQKGLVLFVALIALLIISLAAATLIRSVDTGVLVAGNLAFKQSATISADNGLVSAMSWIKNNGANLTTNSLANGYYASTASALALTSAGSWPDGNPAWSASNSAMATGSGITAGVDTAGNSIRYVVQRMCRNTGSPNAVPAHCLFGIATTGGNSMSGKSDPELGALPSYSTSPMYRVTARVTGPKNTISYIQAYVY